MCIGCAVRCCNFCPCIAVAVAHRGHAYNDPTRARPVSNAAVAPRKENVAPKGYCAFIDSLSCETCFFSGQLRFERADVCTSCCRCCPSNNHTVDIYAEMHTRGCRMCIVFRADLRVLGLLRVSRRAENLNLSPILRERK